MRTNTIQRLSGAVLAMLMIPAVPLPATEPAPAAGFQLDLRAALEAQDSAFALALAPETSARDSAGVAVEISPSELRAPAWSLDEAEGDPTEASAPATKKGFGRWLKKRWYVPLLAAARAPVHRPARGLRVGPGGARPAAAKRQRQRRRVADSRRRRSAIGLAVHSQHVVHVRQTADRR